MALKQVAFAFDEDGRKCDDGRTCPGVFLDQERGVVVVRGPISMSSLPLGDGEAAVEIPLGMYEELSETLG